MTSVSRASFPSGSNAIDLLDQYWSDGTIRLLGSRLDVRYASDEPRIARLARELRELAVSLKEPDPHKACAALAVAGLFQVMRLWCRSTIAEFHFWPRLVQYKTWFAVPNVYVHDAAPDAGLVWPLYHRLAEAGDKARPSFLMAYARQSGDNRAAQLSIATVVENALRVQFASQTAQMLSTEDRLAAVVSRLRARLADSA